MEGQRTLYPQLHLIANRVKILRLSYLLTDHTQNCRLRSAALTQLHSQLVALITEGQNFTTLPTPPSASRLITRGTTTTKMSPVSDVADGDTGDLFQDPEDYYPPTPPPTSSSHTLASGRVLTLHLVGYSPTEAHHLWNGSRVVSDYFEAEPSRVKGKTMLELGAGAGLPSLTAGILGAEKVVVTDFPDVDIVQTMQKNVDEAGDLEGIVKPLGYVWGADVEPLLAELPERDGKKRKFDVLVLADLLFRHSEHGKLVDTIEKALERKKDAVAYVFFTSYRPWLRHKDLAFFDVVRKRGLLVEQVIDRRMEKPLFEGDPGDLEIQKTVGGYEVRWPEELLEG
ncbi:nicotinamide N-methyltransferase [Colletotrichum karsti]|uniref:Protein N-terminal and lysine N-methyltransferase EFM7 n=1 Tax=Colletotrichum karsti TaxID=1095194 RepID=A0A9P6I495_9PEZI|nr:nicotinamide N-methyltransferase [Colletotrichum karsti]KAF9876093.1 nicotinamide N-methyltransferase [Colletotrichum karsti]